MHWKDKSSDVLYTITKWDQLHLMDCPSETDTGHDNQPMKNEEVRFIQRTKYLTKLCRGREGNAGGERGQKQSKTCTGNCSIKTTKQYYSKNLVIKFNGLLTIWSLQQHSKKCLFSLTSHLYCLMLSFLSLHFNLNNISGLSVTIKQTLSRDRGVCQLEMAPLPSFLKVVPHQPHLRTTSLQCCDQSEWAPRVTKRQHAPVACRVVLACSRVSSLCSVVKHCFPPRHLLNTRL